MQLEGKVVIHSKNIRVICLFLARCPPVPLVKNGIVLPTGVVVNHGANVTVICNIGHRFPDGTSVKIFYCDPASEWEELYETTCKSKIILPLIFNDI